MAGFFVFWGRKRTKMAPKGLETVRVETSQSTFGFWRRLLRVTNGVSAVSIVPAFPLADGIAYVSGLVIS